jgi:hypothetical protein
MTFDRMSSFPPSNWECRLIEDFESFSGTPRPDGKLSIAATMAVRYKNCTLLILEFCRPLGIKPEATYTLNTVTQVFVILGQQMASKGTTASPLLELTTSQSRSWSLTSSPSLSWRGLSYLANSSLVTRSLYGLQYCPIRLTALQFKLSIKFHIAFSKC